MLGWAWLRINPDKMKKNETPPVSGHPPRITGGKPNWPAICNSTTIAAAIKRSPVNEFSERDRAVMGSPRFRIRRLGCGAKRIEGVLDLMGRDCFGRIHDRDKPFLKLF